MDNLIKNHFKKAEYHNQFSKSRFKFDWLHLRDQEMICSQTVQWWKK